MYCNDFVHSKLVFSKIYILQNNSKLNEIRNKNADLQNYENFGEDTVAGKSVYVFRQCCSAFWTV